jgi:hypothetical protein
MLGKLQIKKLPKGWIKIKELKTLESMSDAFGCENRGD